MERCSLCGMYSKNIEQHKNTETCKRGRRRRVNRDKQDKQAEVEEVVIKVNGVAIGRVKEVRHLGRILQQNDRDSAYIDDRMKKARHQWNCVAKIL